MDPLGADLGGGSRRILVGEVSVVEGDIRFFVHLVVIIGGSPVPPRFFGLGDETTKHSAMSPDLEPCYRST